ncbi:MAG: polysaccharide pyruvyl transferase family protein [Nitrososphaerales archaeon]
MSSDTLCKDKVVTTRVGTFGYYGRGNIGDEIFLETLQANSYNIIFEDLADSNKHRTRVSKIVPSNDYKMHTKFGVSLYDYSRVVPNKIRTKYLENKLRSFDSVLLGPGGFIWLSRFPPWCDSLYIALKERHVPLHCYGLGVEPADLNNVPRQSDIKILQKWKTLLGLSETVYVRDNFSKKLLQTNSIHDHVVVVNDVAFAYPLPPPRKKDENLVGINLRTKFVKDAEIFADKQQLADIVDFFVDLGYKILLIPFQTRQSNNEAENDLVILEEIFQMAKHKGKVRIVQNASPSEVLLHISSLDFFIGTRYHSVLFALRYGIPTCAIAYRPKVRSLMEEYYDLGEYVVSPNQVSKIKELFIDRHKNHSRAASKTPEIEKATRLQLDSFLNSLLLT